MDFFIMGKFSAIFFPKNRIFASAIIEEKEGMML